MQSDISAAFQVLIDKTTGEISWAPAGSFGVNPDRDLTNLRQLMGEMNERGIPIACEVDVGNAVTMHALSLASGKPAGCLDLNNNYGDDPNKMILFHCGSMPVSR